MTSQRDLNGQRLDVKERRRYEEIKRKKNYDCEFSFLDKRFVGMRDFWQKGRRNQQKKNMKNN